MNLKKTIYMKKNNLNKVTYTLTYIVKYLQFFCKENVIIYHDRSMLYTRRLV